MLQYRHSSATWIALIHGGKIVICKDELKEQSSIGRLHVPVFAGALKTSVALFD